MDEDLKSAIREFEDDPAEERGANRFLVDLDGFEGPIDLLLELASNQKVDLRSISILALAEQYLAYIEEARAMRIEIAADYLVMAAWLAYLKSRLLLPQEPDAEEPTGAALAAVLRFQLQRLEAMREAAKKLQGLPQKGVAFFGRGAPERHAPERQVAYEATLYDLLKAYARNKVRVEASRFRIVPMDLYSVEDALQRLRSVLGQTPGWRALAAFLPPELKDELHRRSAVASTFAATLEMVREGQVRIRQEGQFGPIFLRPAQEESTSNP